MEEVLNIDSEISSILRLNQLVNFVIEQAVKLLNIQRCSLMMIDENLEVLIIKGAYGLPVEVIKSTKVKLGEGISGLIVKDTNPVFVKDITLSRFSDLKTENRYSQNSFMSVPIILHQKVIGVVNVSEKNSSDPRNKDFTDIDFKILLRIVHQAFISIENANYYQKLEYLTRRDSLTKLYNHRHFVQSIDREIQRARRYQRSFSLVMLDVDDFKYFNDVYGHLEGDKILKELSAAIVSVSRNVDICCRYAGDEFIIILPETKIDEARMFIQKLKNAINKIKCEETVSASMGAVEYKNHKETRMDLVRRVDQLLYEEKRMKKTGPRKYFAGSRLKKVDDA